MKKIDIWKADDIACFTVWVCKGYVL